MKVVSALVGGLARIQELGVALHAGFAFSSMCMPWLEVWLGLEGLELHH